MVGEAPTKTSQGETDMAKIEYHKCGECGSYNIAKGYFRYKKDAKFITTKGGRKVNDILCKGCGNNDLDKMVLVSWEY